MAKFPNCQTAKFLHGQFEMYSCSNLIAGNPLTRGGFLFDMFPTQEPRGRGPPSKVSIGPQQTVAGGGTCKSGGGTGKTMIPTFCDVIMPTPQKVTLQLFVDSPFLIKIFIVFDLFLFTFPNGQISKLPNGQISSRPV